MADHQGDASLTPQGRRAALEAGLRLSANIADGQTVSILYSPSARTRETAQEMALGLADGLRRMCKTSVRIDLPRVETAIRNFEFVVDGTRFPPMDAMHPSFPASAARHPYLQAFWGAEQDRIGYWLSHPSECAEAPEAVAERLSLFLQSLLAAPVPDVSLLVTHSGPMRAFLRAAYGVDPGEPEFCEWFLVNASGVQYRGSSRRLFSGNGSSH